MARKKSHPPTQPTPALVVFDPEKAQKAIEAEWDKAFTAANTEYQRNMDTAWRKYVSALKADPTKPGEELWGKERNYDCQYDKDQRAALDRYNTTMNAADKLLESTKPR
jgi:hypothetical protein